jgi:hypothetical protein
MLRISTVFLKKSAIIPLLLYLITPVLATDTSYFEGFNPLPTSIQKVAYPFVAVAGTGDDDPTFVFLKSITNPMMTDPIVDAEVLHIKDRMSQQGSRRNLERYAVLTDSLKPIFGYDSNPFTGVTPMDNHIAVSNDGIVVSVVNTHIHITDTLGNTLQSRVLNATYFGDPNLNSVIFDPKVIYDPDHDRFILAILHGNVPGSSKLLLCFSKSGEPHVDGWNYFAIKGDVFNNGLWMDYPNIGINSKELFVTGNLFNISGRFENNFIFQFNKMDGYNKAPQLGGVLWGAAAGPGQLSNQDGDVPFNLVPAPYVFPNDTFTSMHLVSSNRATSLDVYKITGSLDQNPGLQQFTVQVSRFFPEQRIMQKGADGNPSPILLMGLDNRVTNAFLQNNRIHLVINGKRITDFFSGILYYRIDLKQQTVVESYFKDDATDYTFTSIAPISNNPEEPGVMLVYTMCNSKMFPSIGYITANELMQFSQPTTLKEGESFVNIFSQGQLTRWGDYTGIAKRHYTSPPELWITASYGFHNPSQTLSRQWRNYNARFQTQEPNNRLTSENTSLKVWPNPSSIAMETISVQFATDEKGQFDISLYDGHAKQVQQLHKGELKKGVHQLTFSTQQLSAGTYILRVMDEKNQTIAYEKWIHVGNR